MGFRKASDKALVDIHHCPVLAPRLAALLEPLRQCLSELSIVNRLGHVELFLADSGPLMVLRHLAPLSGDNRQKLEQFLRSHEVALSLHPTATAWNR